MPLLRWNISVFLIIFITACDITVEEPLQILLSQGVCECVCVRMSILNTVGFTILYCVRFLQLVMLIINPMDSILIFFTRSSAAMGHGCYCFALLRSIPAAVYIVLATSLRYHLFVWSVFSPKLLYEGMHTFVTASICVFFTAMDQNRSVRS